MAGFWWMVAIQSAIMWCFVWCGGDRRALEGLCYAGTQKYLEWSLIVPIEHLSESLKTRSLRRTLYEISKCPQLKGCS